VWRRVRHGHRLLLCAEIPVLKVKFYRTRPVLWLKCALGITSVTKWLSNLSFEGLIPLSTALLRCIVALHVVAMYTFQPRKSPTYESAVHNCLSLHPFITQSFFRDDKKRRAAVCEHTSHQEFARNSLAVENKAPSAYSNAIVQYERHLNCYHACTVASGITMQICRSKLVITNNAKHDIPAIRRARVPHLSNKFRHHLKIG